MIVEYKDNVYRVESIIKDTLTFPKNPSLVMVIKKMKEFNQVEEKDQLIFIKYQEDTQNETMVDNLMKKLNKDFLKDTELKYHTRLTIKEEDNNVILNYYIGFDIGRIMLFDAEIVMPE